MAAEDPKPGEAEEAEAISSEEEEERKAEAEYEKGFEDSYAEAHGQQKPPEAQDDDDKDDAEGAEQDSQPSGEGQPDQPAAKTPADSSGSGSDDPETQAEQTPAASDSGGQTDLEKELRDSKAVIGRLEKSIEALTAKFDTLSASSAESQQQKQASSDAGPKDEPEGYSESLRKTVEELKEFEPEEAGKIDKALQNLAEENAKLKSRIEEKQQAQAQEQIEQAKAKLSQQHSDWEQVSASQEFHTWLALNPTISERAKVSNDPDEVSGFLTQFKTEQKMAQNPTPDSDKADKADKLAEARRASAGGVKTKNAPPRNPPESISKPTNQSDEEEYEAAFNKYADEHEQEKRRRAKETGVPIRRY